VAGAALATPNPTEAERFARRVLEPQGDESRPPGGDRTMAGLHGRRLAHRWRAAHVCVTCSAGGAVLSDPRRSRHVPAPPGCDGDPCGAGDRFAASAAGALADGADEFEAVSVGVARASDFVRAGGAGAWAAPAEHRPRAVRPGADAPTAIRHAQELAEATRAGAGVVVATGGCFDLLHAGHIGTLQAARALGDCLIVCLNSDDSVRRLKGPGRPLVRQGDRSTVLSALGCVDAVAIFDDDTPAGILAELRPDVWAKGGDYAPRELPERRVVEAWGGRVVTLPYLDGRSTTGLLKEAAGHGAS
jgi:rfaE bifunctional protein nucleotidyltransferase chain/domain